MKKNIEVKVECSGCDGKGLYVSPSEAPGIAVICTQCKGKGYEDIKFVYTPFTERRKTIGVKRVFQANPGTKLDETCEGGLSFSDWDSGKPFSRGTEIRSRFCPAWWYQSIDYSKKPKWPECIRMLVGAFCNCQNYQEKLVKCWERFDAENK
jgi:hypothetical protein